MLAPGWYQLLDKDLRSMLLAKLGISSWLWELDACCLAALLVQR